MSKLLVVYTLICSLSWFEALHKFHGASKCFIRDQTDCFFFHVLLQSQKQPTPTTRDTKKSVVTQQFQTCGKSVKIQSISGGHLLVFQRLSISHNWDYTRRYKMNSKTHYNWQKKTCIAPPKSFPQWGEKNAGQIANSGFFFPPG